MMNIVEQSRIRHAEGGFCRIINCPECELKRGLVIAPGKTLVALKSDLERVIAAQTRMIEDLTEHLEQCQDSRNFWMEQAEARRDEADEAWAEAAEAWETVCSFLEQ